MKRVTARFSMTLLLVGFIAQGSSLIAAFCVNTRSLVAGGYSGAICSMAEFTSGANSTVNGTLTAQAAVTLGANSKVNNFVDAGTAYTGGDGATVTGNVTAGTTYTSGANSVVWGDVIAAGDITLGAYSRISGSAHSGTGVITYGDGATVGSVLP